MNLESLNTRILQAEELGDAAALGALLTEDFIIIRKTGAKQDRPAFLAGAPKAKALGRAQSDFTVREVGECATVQLKITTQRDPDGTSIVRSFWNTRVFVKESGTWKCMMWQNTEIN